MTNSGSFEDRVARLQAQTDQQSNVEAQREADRVSQWQKTAPQLETAISDLIQYLAKRAPAERLRIHPGQGMFSKGKMYAPAGWLIAYFENMGWKTLSSVDILQPDGTVWEYSSTYKSSRVENPAENYRLGRPTSFGHLTIKLKGSDIVAEKLVGHDTVEMPLLDAFAELSQTALNLAINGLPANIKH